VFISYRREETAAHTGRLFDSIAARFGERNVFLDVDMAPGIDFVERINQAVGGCDVLLAVIGPRWATLADDEGHPRLADPEDFVRLEVETALRRRDVTVIPVLVGGAHMPDPDVLPGSVRHGSGCSGNCACLRQAMRNVSAATSSTCRRSARRARYRPTVR
jgi:hypothetical protein